MPEEQELTYENLLAAVDYLESVPWVREVSLREWLCREPTPLEIQLVEKFNLKFRVDEWQ